MRRRYKTPKSFRSNELRPSAYPPGQPSSGKTDHTEPQGAIARKRGRQTIDYPATQSPTMIDIVGTAKFWQGEGHVSVRQNQFYVSIGQNDREELDRIQSMFGGKVYGPYTNRAGNDFYEWRLVRERALGFMFTIFTFLSKDRREQFKAALRGQPQARTYQKTISDEGISEAWIKRKLTQHLKRKAKELDHPMGIFGLRRR